MLFPVIMAGGTGTRFWPKSRANFPKQFFKIVGDESLLQATIRRVNKIVPKQQVYVVTNRELAPRVKQEVQGIPDANIIVEPLRRDTAACIGLALTHLSKRNPSGVAVMLPSDHYIADEEIFVETIKTAVTIASKQDVIVTLGIRPTAPKTGYGYIRYGAALGSADNHFYFKVDTFTEKPSINRALEFLASGKYLWNSGIFVCKISVLLDEYRRYLPDIAASLGRVSGVLESPQEDEITRSEYKSMSKISIDYGIMEKATNVVVLPADFGWDDVGSWAVLEKLLPVDSNNNIIQGLHVGIDTYGCIIDSEEKLVATIGVRDLIIIQSGDVVLVCPKERDQEVKKIVEQLRDPPFGSFG